MTLLTEDELEAAYKQDVLDNIECFINRIKRDEIKIVETKMNYPRFDPDNVMTDNHGSYCLIYERIKS